MNEDLIKEKNFEEAIANYLVEKGGYSLGDPTKFDKVMALDKTTFIEFIKNSQPKSWEKYCIVYSKDPEEYLVKRFNDEVNDRGLLDVLRKGFKDRGIQFKICFFKPETSLNSENIKKFQQNIFHCTRQLHYSVKNENSIDIVLFLNGIPIVTMELKCQFTGQNTFNAIKQYKLDRNSKDKIFDFRNRSLIHFAVDMLNVYMTTELKGEKTYFLPFNQGSNGAGNVGGAGNPLIEDDYITSYLWKKVLIKDRLLEILQKYMHLQSEDILVNGKIIKKGKMIFPRYHQLDVVTKLLDDVKERGPGKNYLIQHSAGSGKSNSIAWLAHRLAGLHNKNDEKIFRSVIVVTDRKVLDTQLQETIYQFDHVLGVVEKIDKNKHSSDLRDAINANKQIIITTIQKFPIIFQEVQSAGKNFAVIVDEAHSSQTGEAAKKLKIALGDTEEELEKIKQLEEEEENNKKDYEDKMLEEMASHGNLKNLSFFAFTATPKEKTLQLFGEKMPDGRFKAFHIYSMKQAIEEHFILDVLQNYVTYKMYYKIIKKVTDDPNVDTKKGIKEIIKYESLHPHNIAQKTAIMIEHFRNITKNKIGGKAKAMVVTSSRLHAVRYLFAFRDYIKLKNYTDLNVLVAFSGDINENGMEWSEEKLNKDKSGKTIKEEQLRNVFHTDEFNVLIVAEKYQTGFDEPLLHTMFVDKKLYGVKAVQTLSRLNRTMPGKEDTFVLDFVNTAEDIQKSFEPYYQATILERESDPNIIYSLKNKLDDYHIYQTQEIVKFAEAFYNKNLNDNDKNLQAILISCLKPAIDRYSDIKERATKDTFKGLLGSFIRLYSFITQVCRMNDLEMQKFYRYSKYLIKCLPYNDNEKVDLKDKLLLEYYRLDKTYEGKIEIGESEDLQNIKGDVGAKPIKKDPLSEIINKMNDRFGTDFTEMDKVLDQVSNDITMDETLKNAAINGDMTLYSDLYEKKFKEAMTSRYEENDKFFNMIFTNKEMFEFIKDRIKTVIYEGLRK